MAKERCMTAEWSLGNESSRELTSMGSADSLYKVYPACFLAWTALKRIVPAGRLQSVRQS